MIHQISIDEYISEIDGKPILYSTYCPKCTILETKLKQQGIDFNVVDDIELMKKLGITHAPQLNIEGRLYDFNGAIRYLKERANG